MTRTERNLARKIAESWTREKDSANPRGLEVEIQHQLGCSYGRAATIANDIRVRYFPLPKVN